MTLNFTINDVAYALPVRREGFSMKETVGAEGKHSTSSVSLRVPASDETNLLITSKGDVRATLKRNGSVIMTGIVRPFLNASWYNTTSEDVEIQLLDLSEAMHVYVWPTPAEGEEEVEDRIYPRIYRDSSLRTVMEELFGLVGVSIDATTLPEQNLYWIQINGEEYIDDIIQQILYGYGYDFKFTPDGVAEFFYTFAPEQIGSTISDIRGNVQLSRSDDRTDGVRLLFNWYKTSSSAQLYKATYNIGNGMRNDPTGNITVGGIPIGYWYNGSLHLGVTITQTWPKKPTKHTITWTPKVDGKEIPKDDVLSISTDESRVTATIHSPIISKPLPDYNKPGTDAYENGNRAHLTKVDFDGATFYLAFNGVWIGINYYADVKIKGNVIYRVDADYTVGITGPSPDEISLRYLFCDEDDKEYVQNLAEAFYKRQQSAKITLSFKTLTKPSVGAFYNIGGEFPQLSGLGLKCRVISVETDADGLYSVTAECVDRADIVAEVYTRANIEDEGGASSGMENVYKSENYSEEGENEDGEKGFYLNTDGTAKFNSIKIEGDGADFQSDVFKTTRPIVEYRLIDCNVSYGNQVPSEVSNQLLVSVPHNTPLEILEGTVTLGGYEISTGSSLYITEGWTDGGEHYLRVTLWGDIEGEIPNIAFNPDTLSEVGFYDKTFSFSNVGLTSLTPGIMVKDVMPFSDNAIYSIGKENRPFDIHAGDLHFNTLYREGDKEVRYFIDSASVFAPNSLTQHINGNLDIYSYGRKMNFIMGFIPDYASGTKISIEEMKDEKYLVFVSFGGSVARSDAPSVYAKTTTGFKVVHSASLNNGFGLYYMVIGEKA